MLSRAGDLARPGRRKNWRAAQDALRAEGFDPYKVRLESVHGRWLKSQSHDLRARCACFVMRKAVSDEEVADALGRRLETHAPHSPAFFQGRIAKLATKGGADL